MKRKIIKQGHNTLTITLPSKWAKSFNLQAGSEIDMQERENGLFISTEKKGEELKTEIDISGLDIPAIWKYLMSVYREGYDEVIVKFDSSIFYDNPYKFFTRHAIDMKYGGEKLTPFEMIQLLTNRFVGFELIEQHRDHCVIKDMGEISSKEFENSLRRVFLLIQQMGEDLVESIRDNKPKILGHAHDIDINVDKFHDYCVRVLNKTGFKDTIKTNLLFSSIYILEMLGDEFKHIAHHLLKDMAGKNFDNLLELAELTLEQFNKFYDLYYNYDKSKLMSLSKTDMEIHSYLPRLYKKKPNKKSELSEDEKEIFNHLRTIGKYINALVELRVGMEY